MADTYEKDLAQKSTLTINDYIRVVGSDNVSYKQKVSSVGPVIASNYAITEISRVGYTQAITVSANSSITVTVDVSSDVSGYTGWTILYCNSQSTSVLATNYWHGTNAVNCIYRNTSSSEISTTAQIVCLRWK